NGAAVGRRSPARPPPGVGDAVVGDGEHPPPQGGVVAPEPRQVPHDVEEDLAEEVFGLGGTLAADVAEHGRCQRPVHAGGVAVGVAAVPTPRTNDHDTAPDAGVVTVVAPPGAVVVVVVVFSSCGPEPAGAVVVVVVVDVV